MERFSLPREEAVLVIVDVQERLAAVMEKREEVAERCLHLLEASKLLYMPVVVTER